MGSEDRRRGNRSRLVPDRGAGRDAGAGDSPLLDHAPAQGPAGLAAWGSCKTAPPRIYVPEDPDDLRDGLYAGFWNARKAAEAKAREAAEREKRE